MKTGTPRCPLLLKGDFKIKSAFYSHNLTQVLFISGGEIVVGLSQTSRANEPLSLTRSLRLRHTEGELLKPGQPNRVGV